MRKLNNQEFLEQCESIHGTLYDYSESIYINSRTKLIIKCKIHNKFKQTPNNHLAGKGCPLCSGNKKLNKKSFIKRCNKELFNYSLVEYVNRSTKVIIGCKKCNKYFDQEPRAHLMGQGCPYCAGKRKTRNEWLNEFKEAHGDLYSYENVSDIISSNKISIICKIHGEFTQEPRKHKSGQGCPACKLVKLKHNNKKKYINKITYLYYIQIGKYFKIGLTTSNLKERYKQENIKYKIIDVWEFDNGADAFDIEQSVLSETYFDMVNKEDSPINGGSTELRYTDCYKLILRKVLSCK